MRIRIAVATLMLAAAAVAGTATTATAQDEDEPNAADESGLTSFGNESDLLSNVNVCQLETYAVAVPVISTDESEGSCLASAD
ncbi:hypothetical protein [Streptomyces sp. NPDC046727]|uniref:hypothetical protein n=1 Tax=Streptomyces sp. NPDC046727 TaxID=3155373 RepID=UPI0033C28F7D